MIWRERVEEQGFGLIPEVLTQAEIAQLTEDLTQSGLQRSRAGVRHALGLAAVAALAQDPRLFEIARGIFGKQALPFKATLFDKSSSANWLVVWHQDTALPMRARRETPGWGPWSLKEGVIYAHAPASALRRVLALRVHLDDSTADNGPLRILPIIRLTS